MRRFAPADARQAGRTGRRSGSAERRSGGQASARGSGGVVGVGWFALRALGAPHKARLRCLLRHPDLGPAGPPPAPRRPVAAHRTPLQSPGPGIAAAAPAASAAAQTATASRPRRPLPRSRVDVSHHAARPGFLDPHARRRPGGPPAPPRQGPAPDQEVGHASGGCIRAGCAGMRRERRVGGRPPPTALPKVDKVVLAACRRVAVSVRAEDNKGGFFGEPRQGRATSGSPWPPARFLACGLAQALRRTQRAVLGSSEVPALPPCCRHCGGHQGRHAGHQPRGRQVRHDVQVGHPATRHWPGRPGSVHGCGS